MGTKEEASSASKTNNRVKALERIDAVMGKYKLIKVPSLIQDVVRHVFGDLAKDEDRADKAFALISSLVNELVSEGSLDTYTFSNVSMLQGQETPSIVNETIVVLPSFQLVGYEKSNLFQEETAEDDSDSDSEAQPADDLFNEIDVNEVLANSTEAYAIVTFTAESATAERSTKVEIRHAPESALGTFLNRCADETSDVRMYAMVPVNLEVKTSVESNDEPIPETLEQVSSGE